MGALPVGIVVVPLGFLRSTEALDYFFMVKDPDVPLLLVLDTFTPGLVLFDTFIYLE